MMLLIKITYVLGTLLLCGYAYHWFGSFKRLSECTCDEFNAEILESEENICESEALAARNFSYTIFVVTGLLIWSFLGVTMGKVATEMTSHSVLRWIVYFTFYLLFVRLPVGATSRAIVEIYSIERLPEKYLFTVVALTFYIMSIFWYDSVPFLWKWHLFLF